MVISVLYLVAYSARPSVEMLCLTDMGEIFI